ncbi:MAG: hypothetical protein COX43_01670 [Parcubacteria group bacterium CG23_combo_of_CG06-09_8_20_14_all_35_9]|nr:MAG: hypothetical protein COX43_01670 [Parcubacteria group bacterium CG23_combo_of_CG06-09_8_20_14_all_35_9]
MTTEEQILEILWDQGGEAPITTIASLVKISVDYARMICRNLAEKDYIKFDLGIAKLKGKGKLEAAKRKVDFPQKIVVEGPNVRIGKKRKLILDY